MYADISDAINSFLAEMFLIQFKFNQTILVFLGYLSNMIKKFFYIKLLKILFHIQIFTIPSSLMKLLGNV